MSNQNQGRRNTVTLTVLAVAACLVAAAGYLSNDDAGDAGRLYLRNGSGAVLFDHAAHQAQSDACVSCHHELAGDVADCSDCHDDPDYGPDSADHDELVEFHESACDNCHDIAPDADAESCRSCHDDAIADVYHTSCNACHLASAPARFADEDGKAACNRCHLK